MSAQALQFLAQAHSLLRAGRGAEAIERCNAALLLDPRCVDALNLLGQLRAEQENFTEALQLLGRSLQVNPRQPFVLNIEGILFAQSRNYDGALRSLNNAILLKPDFAEAFLNRGNVRQELKQPDEALADFQTATMLRPDYADAWTNRGNILQELGRFGDAVTSYDKALALQPDPDALSNCGNALARLLSFDEALARFERAIALQPDHAAAYHGKGAALAALGRYDDAVAAYERAIALRPDNAESHSALAYVLCSLKRFEEALAHFDRALALDPTHPYIAGDRLCTQMYVAIWDRFDEQCANILRAIRAGAKASSPSALLAIPSDAKTSLQCAETYIADKVRSPATTAWTGKRYTHERIRMGYYSADFHGHATAHLLAEVLEKHDRQSFEIVAFSYGPDIKDTMRVRLERSVDRFIDVRQESDAAIGVLSRRHEIDIAVDLKGITVDNRAGIFAPRVAPVQVNYLGFPGTTGARHMDYVIADPTLIPPEHIDAYSEKIVYLPHSYQPNDRQRPIADRVPSRAEAGLPATGFVFCCFNSTYKITPDLFALWMRLLEHGIAPERLVFAPRVESAAHLARHRLADLFLDTFYCNAHTTASDALWAGLPVLTLLGNTFTSRVAASLLYAVGLPELIARAPAEYEELALRLAQQPALLASLRGRLADNRLTQPLFDSALYARHLEKAYATMWERQQRGEKPDHIRIES
jgi:predicted O-linked N-acetylglucosamine transferase (SPINDLY family)